jgi:hypothetical protein
VVVTNTFPEAAPTDVAAGGVQRSAPRFTADHRHTGTRFEDADLVDRVTALAIRLGGDPDQVFFQPGDGNTWP